jgi:predicted phage terminase large subunit-like protein
MIFMPPRHGKSELASRRFPAWFMGRNPKLSIIAASYNSDLAGDFGREVRNIVASPEHANLFPSSALAQDSKSQNRWHTNAGGGYAAAGVGTAVTGRGAHVFLIDDPVKDRESADSELIREKTYRWYLSTAYTRLEGTLTEWDRDPLWRDLDEAQTKGEAFEGAIVLVQTRWHEDDLAGRLLLDMERGADQWEVLSLPAMKEAEGKVYALWPEKYDADRLERIKRQLSAREWQSLYQQEPTPDAGTFFKREWFEFGRKRPDNLAVYMTSDFAVTDGGGDYTELAVWGIDANEQCFALDWWSGQTAAMEWIEQAISLMARWKPRAFFGEGGPIKATMEPVLRKRMRERKTFCRLEWLPRVTDKASSARGFQARAEMGLVSFPEMQWARDVVEQLVSFPTGKHDDKVDACALLGMALDQAHPAILLGKDDASGRFSRPNDEYGHREEDAEDSWKTI